MFSLAESTGFYEEALADPPLPEPEAEGEAAPKVELSQNYSVEKYMDKEYR